jgi:hypothetical protein
VNVQDMLTKYIAKVLLMRGARDVKCRVFKQSGGGGPYPVIIDRGAVSEQFFLNARDVDVFVRTGTEINLTNEVRAALKNLDRRYQKKMAGRG